MRENESRDDNLSQARAAFRRNSFERAIKYYKTALKEKAIVWAELSWVYYQKHDYEQAVEAVEMVLSNDPTYPACDDLYRVAGYAHLALKNASLAEKYLSESIAFNATEDKQQYAKFELGKLYFSQGNYDLAFPYFKDIENFFKKRDNDYYLSILFFMGFINYYLENNKESKIYFDRILNESKDRKRKASAFYGHAYIAFKEKNFLNVISLCEHTIAHDPDFFDKESIGFLTAASYFHLGRIDIFNAYYYQLIKNYPAGRYQKELNQLYNSPSNTKN